MDAPSTVDAILVQALSLSPGDRLRIVQALVESVNREMPADLNAPAAETHWGRDVIALLDSLDLSDWEAMAMDDPVAWLRQMRASASMRANKWDDDSE